MSLTGDLTVVQLGKEIELIADDGAGPDASHQAGRSGRVQDVRWYGFLDTDRLFEAGMVASLFRRGGESMIPWPKHPVIYQVNTWVWLGELSRKYERPVTLSTVTAEEWDGLAPQGADAVWLMGVWERSPVGIAIANQNAGLVEDFQRALADFRPEDNVGSPYCVRQYVVDEHLGGREGLAVARSELAGRGLKLILDFVPNHVAPDHPWAGDHVEYFVAWCWRGAGERHLIVVNLSDSRAQAQVRLPWGELKGQSWRMTDLLSGQDYERGGDAMCDPGLYVDLPPWGFHVLAQWLPVG